MGEFVGGGLPVPVLCVGVTSVLVRCGARLYLTFCVDHLLACAEVPT